VWIVLQIHFGNDKTSLYCSETRYGIDFQRTSSESIENKGFQQNTPLKHYLFIVEKSAEILYGAGFYRFTKSW